MNNDNWFVNGLKFSCQGCGGCCKGPGGYVWVTEEEINRFADVLNLSQEVFIKKYIRNVQGRLSLIDNIYGDCIFMNDEGGCKYYDQRPSQCKTFPWWPELIASKEVWEENSYNCPGIGIGRLYSEVEILKDLEEE